VLDLWNEKKDARSLAENANYGAIANRCRGSKDEEPQVIWFVDPVGYMKKLGETNIGVQSRRGDARRPWAWTVLPASAEASCTIPSNTIR